MGSAQSPADVLGSIDLPLYGLPAFDRRERWLASWSSAPAWVLAHGVEGAPDRVDVGVMQRTHSITDAPAATPGGRRIGIFDTLATELFFGRYELPESLETEDERRQWVHDLWARARQATWARDMLVVDGEALHAWRLDERGHWVAFAETGDVWLYAHSRGTPIAEVTLVRIPDPAPHVAAAASR